MAQALNPKDEVHQRLETQYKTRAATIALETKARSSAVVNKDEKNVTSVTFTASDSTAPSSSKIMSLAIHTAMDRAGFSRVTKQTSTNALLSEMSSTSVGSHTLVHDGHQWPLYAMSDVGAYEWTQCTPQLNVYQVPDTDNKTEPVVYFLLEAPGEDAFAHWIYESAVFLPLLGALRSVYPHIQLLTRNTKRYVKNLLLFMGYGDVPVVHYDQRQLHNLVLVPPLVSLNDRSLECGRDSLFGKMVNHWVDDVRQRLELDVDKRTVKCGSSGYTVFLPRNTRENYAANDRIVPQQQELIDSTIASGGIVLPTFEINNFYYQWMIVACAETVIVDYGSSFLVNCVFLKNKRIRVINSGSMLATQYTFPGMKHIVDHICAQNKVEFV